jgi:hypothetical protein
MISKTTILFSTKYEEILKSSDYDDAIMLIDIIQQIFNYYDKIFFDEEIIFNFFFNAKALVLVVLSNSPSNRNLLKNYIYNCEQYNNDNNDYSLSRSLNLKNQLVLYNKHKQNNIY